VTEETCCDLEDGRLYNIAATDAISARIIRSYVISKLVSLMMITSASGMHSQRPLPLPFVGTRVAFWMK
jgi:hypothetical protein